MSYKLFIDDLRDPVTNDWKIARSSKEAIEIVSEFGMPSEIAFDHDLGGQDTSINFIHWLVDQLIESKIWFDPHTFKYSVHSMNPVGAENIKYYINTIIRWMKDKYYEHSIRK